MTHSSPNPGTQIAAWHRNLLAAAAIFTILLIGMGGVLCVTQSIRSCPDWPGCFGKLLPPLQTSPILEVTHRLLAGSSGLLILAGAIAGLARARRLGWILVPPLAACVLLVEVSYFGAVVVLHGIAPGWAAVDIGSALLVAALMISSAMAARAWPDRPTFRTPFARLGLVTAGVVYAVLVSGVLVSGKNSITGCLGWPVYSPRLFQLDSPGVGNILRLGLSVLGILLMVSLLVQALRRRQAHPAVFRTAAWVLAAFLLEAVLQALLLVFGFKVALLAPYTLSMASLWGLLVALGMRAGLEEA
jgi:heme a synthase